MAAADGYQSHDGPDAVHQGVSIPLSFAHSAVLQSHPDRKLQRSKSATVQVPAHANRTLSTATLLSENESEEAQMITKLCSRSLSTWLDDTLNVRIVAISELSIPESTMTAESVTRFTELSRQSALRSSDGRVAESFLRSDADVNQVNWPRDGYCSMLAMSVFDPLLCADVSPCFRMVATDQDD